ncbi:MULTISPECIES: hypothetical protein [Kitasatospora]|uniref:Uncharacterized protein n=1 Tax=Kitasatospora cathayae TaxID=3004092 RepID=A0ABY7QEM4_9ACTN|nr:hypothetical protein [Kitasatospora sp. HUAS 3-15]WBP90546.1 hypothetical protein O1G21_34920 [Kitasatospora sp. HUAS 3-15]
MGKKSELDDLRARLATLEAEVDRLRGEAAAAGATTTAQRGERGQPQSMTRIADAVGVMVSGRTEERTRVLRARAEPLESSRSAPLPEHGQFLENLLSGRPALQEELRRR